MTQTFTLTQKSIITGSLLGDGSISKKRTKNENSYFCKGQAERRHEYLEWHYQQFQPFSSCLSKSQNACKGKQYGKSVFTTRSHPLFSALRDKWYPNGKKIVPVDIRLDPLAIAVWFFDDGDNCLKRRICNIATCAFSLNEVEILRSQLANFNFITSVKIRKDGRYPRLTILSKSYRDFIDLVRPYMLWDCFGYKVVYRDAYSSLPDGSRKLVSEQQILDIVKKREEGWTYKEIGIEFGISQSCAFAVSNKKTKLHLWKGAA